MTGESARDEFRDQLQRALGPAYVLQRELAGGGMSRVFVATESALQRDVVIKVLPPELAAGVNRERFRREIQLAAGLQHPHIVPLLSSGESGDLLYYTMPFIRGESLKDVLEHRGALPTREVIRILHEVVDALAYAHEHGVIHRDIKPANVLMSGSHAVITDFGVAKALGASLSMVTVTSSGMMIGTPAYMAPEQLAADPAADARVDVYAVGLLAYELLTGKAPFAGRSSPQAMMAAQLTETPKPLTAVVPDVPPGLAMLIMRCLEKAPEARPRSARALHDALDALTSPEGNVCAPTPPSSRPPTRRAVAAVTALLTVAIISALAVTLRHRPTMTTDLVRTKAVPDSTRAAARQQGAVLLTHADSLAIAAAVEARMDSARRRVATEPAPHRAMSLDSLRVQLERAVTDSMRRLALLRRTRGFGFDSARGGSLEPPRFSGEREPPRIPGGLPLPVNAESIVRGAAPWFFAPDSATLHRVAIVAELSTGGPASLAGPARAMADSLRAQLAARGFDVVAADAPRVRGYPTSDPLRLARANHAALGITGVVLLQEGDSVAYMLMIGDLRRGQDVRTLTGGRAALADPLRDVGPFAAAVARMIEHGRR